MNCKEVARFVSEQKDRTLPLHRRLGVRFHLVFCGMCRRYQKHLELISRIAARAGQMGLTASGPSGEELSGDAKDRIRQRLTDTDDGS